MLDPKPNIFDRLAYFIKPRKSFELHSTLSETVCLMRLNTLVRRRPNQSKHIRLRIRYSQPYSLTLSSKYGMTTFRICKVIRNFGRPSIIDASGQFQKQADKSTLIAVYA